MPQNPKWTRDELILGLDLYLRINPLRTTHEDPAILDLSRVLNSLPFHPRSEREATFRNPVGVYMTLRTFLRWDPNYSGKGLEGGSLGKLIWDEFSQDPERLSAIAGLIRKSALVVSTSISIHGLLDEEDTFPE